MPDVRRVQGRIITLENSLCAPFCVNRTLPLCLCYYRKLRDLELWPSSQTAQWCERDLFSSNKERTLWICALTPPCS